MPRNNALARAVEAAHRAGPAESATVNHLLLAASRGDALLACNWWPPTKVAGYHGMNQSLQLCQPSAFLGRRQFFQLISITLPTRPVSDVQELPLPPFA